MISYTETPIQRIETDWLQEKAIRLFVKREDLNHPFISGNKWWKLKYNLEEALRQEVKKLLTFGGAFSNHIVATSAAAKEFGIESVGVIRGEATMPLNSVLSFARSQQMELFFVSRDEYRKKNEKLFIENLKKQFGNFYLIPEGGTNDLAVRGCEELGKKISQEMAFDYLCLPVGTGGTMAGLVAGLGRQIFVLGFSVLKNGGFLRGEVSQLLSAHNAGQHDNWEISTQYDFGGYAKGNRKLYDFVLAFEREQKISLDAVYTGKMMYGIYDLIKNGYFPKGTSILAVHTGGVQIKDTIAIVSGPPTV